MHIAVDIGNTRLKCRRYFPDGSEDLVLHFPLCLEKKHLEELIPAVDICPNPLYWLVAQTGTFPWQELQSKIHKLRPLDEFQIITYRHIPLKIDVDFPEKVGIDRLLAAYAAVKEYGDVPMLIVDAGSAITVDVVRNQTFCGGAILPGLTALSETYPKISKKLPRPFPDPLNDITGLVYPGKNTESAIYNGLYWGTVGAIRQFYEMLSSHEKNVLLVLTGGYAYCLEFGLDCVILPPRLKYHDYLVLEGIHQCFGG
jgi:type III pantothenate kinase